MARTRKYKTLKGLLRALGDPDRKSPWHPYIDVELMRKKKAYFPRTREYHKFILSEAAEDEFWLGIAKVVWSRNAKANMYNLRDCRYFGLMRRLWWNGNRYEYCAGQDYPSEIRTIQRASRQF